MLERTNNDIFKEFYEGINGNTKVTAILDTNCVRYMVFKKISTSWKRTARREFVNDKKEMCLKNANKALRV